MPTPHKALLRLAVSIHRHLARSSKNRPSIELPTSSWLELERLARLLRRARQHDWHLAAVRLTRELASRLDVLRREAGELTDRLTADTPEPTAPALVDVYRDLVALHDEFPTVDWDVRHGMLSVTTEPITLEGVNLGAFEIRLDWRDLPDFDSYRVVARDPNPAASNSSVTHPHVEGEVLCQGEAHVPLRKALTEGRLTDFFLIVAGVLRTYNEGSPFVPLDRWDGVVCAHCDCRLDEDDVSICETCGARVCDECCFCCPACQDTSCYPCARHCRECDGDHCRGCVRRCRECRRWICSECLLENERCKTCHDKTKPSPHDASPCAAGDATVAAG